MELSTNPWVWLGVFFTLSVYSFLYKDNVFYKIAEHVTIGVSLGYSVYIVWTSAFIGQVWEQFSTGGFIFNWNVSHRWDYIIPAILGLFMIFRLFPKYAWMSRYSLALVVGAAAGMGLPRVMQAFILKQVTTTMVPVSFTVAGINNFVIFVGVLTVLLYFYFSKEHKGIYGKFANVGIWYLMVGFGATFGYTVMARMSLFIGRILFLLQEALGMKIV